VDEVSEMERRRSARGSAELWRALVALVAVVMFLVFLPNLREPSPSPLSAPNATSEPGQSSSGGVEVAEPSEPSKPPEPVIVSVRALPVKVEPKLFSDEVSSLEDPSAIDIDENPVTGQPCWTWTDECARSGKHSLKGRAAFRLLLGRNRSDFNLYDKMVMHVRVEASEEALKELDYVWVGFGIRGSIRLTPVPLEESEWIWPDWICNARVSRDGDWWRVELYDIKWEGVTADDRLRFTIVPVDPKLYKLVTFYVDDIQLYSSRSEACLLLVEVERPLYITEGNKTYVSFRERTEALNLRTKEAGESWRDIHDRDYLKELYNTTINDVYVPVAVEPGDELEVTFTFYYYRKDEEGLHSDDCLTFTRTVKVVVER